MSSSHRSHRHHLKCCMSCMFSVSLEWMLDTNWAWAWVRNPLTFGFRCISLTEQRTEQRLSHSVTRVARFHLHGTAGQLIKPPADLDDSSHEKNCTQTAVEANRWHMHVHKVHSSFWWCGGVFLPYIWLCMHVQRQKWLHLVPINPLLRRTSYFILHPFTYYSVTQVHFIFVFVQLSIFFYHM